MSEVSWRLQILGGDEVRWNY